MIESIATVCVFVAYVAMLFVAVFFSSTEKRICALFLGFLFIPSCVALWDHPSISVRDTLLYTFFLGEIIHNQSLLKKYWKNFPLKGPLLFIFVSYCVTSFFAGREGLGKAAYETVRSFFDVFSLLFVGFYVGNEIKGKRLLELFSVPLMIFCALGVVEAMLHDSYAFRYICKAFPIYKGVYWLESAIDLSESWRTRIIVTTDHPNALAGLLVTLFFFFFAYIDKSAAKVKRLYIVLSLLGVCSILCGSRTLVFLLVAVTGLYFFMKLKKITKVIVVFAAAISLFLGVQAYSKFMETFNQEGQGSSIELRFVQLAVSYAYFMNSPIYGNGLHYIQKDILETDSGGGRGDEDAKFFESLLFYLLINFGMVGLASYMVLIFALLIYFLKRRRKFIEANQGFLVTVALFAILFLNGNSGNYFNCGLMIVGLCLGNCMLAENEDSSEEEKKDVNNA